MHRVLVATALAVSLTGCTSGGSSAQPTATPTATGDPCLGASPGPECTQPSPTAFPYPADASKVPAVSLEPIAGELGRVDNTRDPARRTAVLTIVVPRGQVIASDLVCQGRGSVAITTSPKSLAEQNISCDSNDVPSRFGVFASAAETADRTYVVTVRATGPSRWVVAMSAQPKS